MSPAITNGATGATAATAATAAKGPAAAPGAPRRTEFSPERMIKFHEYAEEYPNKRSALMMVLCLAEGEFGCITDEAMEIVAGLCNVSVAHVQGMVTFYTHFKRPFHGKHRFMVCATLMCALENNTDAALDQIKAKLGLRAGDITHDGLFSCEKVECLADCDRPPVVQKDNEHFCSMKGAAMDAYLDKLLKEEGKTTAEYLAKGPVKMDTRVSYMPSNYNFQGETETGARKSDDKNPYTKAGEGAMTTRIPAPLATPLTVPVADGVNAKGAPSNGRGGHDSAGGSRPLADGAQTSSNGHHGKGSH